jgi:transposase InsO family protein
MEKRPRPFLVQSAQRQWQAAASQRGQTACPQDEKRKPLLVFFIMKLETREIIRFDVTAHPDIRFLRNQFSVFEDEHPGAYLIHDNSGELKHFPYREYNIKDAAIAPYSPNMNAYAERFVRSIRQECLNFFIIFTYG